MRAPVERLPRRSSRLSHPVVLGCVSFTIGGPLIAALVWPAVMLIAWSLIDGPSWKMLGACAGMVPLVFVASFVFGYFVPATIAGGILGAIGTRLARRWFVLLGIVVGTGMMVGYVLLLTRLMKSDDIGGINVIAILDTIVTSAVMSRWLHRRLERAG
ncbi:hypothetical protein KEC55_19590 [Burkholderia cepacia]|uniref:hypothetical protein n=1 Tax=Burkholderia cepacia TaxID=292 RepID=UPI00249E239C|nr:hypothetical protein [Burkholderia cepacia]WGY72017.1 hypothetical protein KEC55_19590 [Burkholderia cepacia]